MIKFTDFFSQSRFKKTHSKHPRAALAARFLLPRRGTCLFAQHVQDPLRALPLRPFQAFRYIDCYVFCIAVFLFRFKNGGIENSTPRRYMEMRFICAQKSQILLCVLLSRSLFIHQSRFQRSLFFHFLIFVLRVLNGATVFI